MNIIFLDVDGVLVTEKHIVSEHARTGKANGREFDPACVEQLNRIIKEVQPDFVLSSTWRILSPLNEFEEYARQQGVENARFIGITPYGVKMHDGYSHKRGHEIQYFLNETGLTGEKFCIIDDDDDMEHLSHKLFKTTFNDGLTPEIADKIIKYFDVKNVIGMKLIDEKNRETKVVAGEYRQPG